MINLIPTYTKELKQLRKAYMYTCDKCKNWTPEDLQSHFPEYKDQGACSLFGDVNKGTPRNDVCYGEDYACYAAGVVVMAKFGCIHWEGK